MQIFERNKVTLLVYTHYLSVPHRWVLLHNQDPHPFAHHLLLFQPVGDGPAHHPASDDHDIRPLWRKVGVDLQRSPAAPWKRVHRLLPHSFHMGLQIWATKPQTLHSLKNLQMFTFSYEIKMLPGTLAITLKYGI